jgi:signal transduction histidine kinase
VTRNVYDLVRLPVVVVDTVTAGLFAVVVVVLPAFLQRQIGVYPLASDGLFSLALVAPLAIRRALPVASFALVSGLCWLQLWVIPRPMWSDLAFLVALASVTRYAPTWARWSGLGVGMIGAVVGPLDWLGGLDSIHHREDLYPMYIALFAVLSAWILGDLRRTRADYVAELEARNERLAVERDQQAVLAAAAERQRIAREMHDVVAHSLSVVVVQADGGRYLADRDPESAKRALDTIAASARSALGDMRRLLGLLREDGHGGVWSPQPGADDVAQLVDGVRSSGLEVTLEIEGDSKPDDATTGLTIYRIVQEGLTNAIKHAGPGARVSVRIRYADGRAHVVVSDDGSGPSGWPGRDGSGRGLIGMRERVELHGGTLHTRVRPGGGFELDADLPLSHVEVG